MNALFITWGLCFVYAAVRTPRRAWVELSVVAATLAGALPVLNALTTERHLGVSLPAHDWVLAGFDLSAIGVGVCFAWLATMVRRKDRAEAAKAARDSERRTRRVDHGVATPEAT